MSQATWMPIETASAVNRSRAEDNPAFNFRLGASRMTPEQTLAEIYALCQLHAHPGCNTGAHALAAKIVRMIEELEGFDPDSIQHRISEEPCP